MAVKRNCSRMNFRARILVVSLIISSILVFTYLIIPTKNFSYSDNNKNYHEDNIIMIPLENEGKRNFEDKLFYDEDELLQFENSKNRNVNLRHFVPKNTFNILMWTSNKTVPFKYLKKGNQVFVNDNCEYTNCYITNNEKDLKDVTLFDAVIFHGADLIHETNFHRNKPSKRGTHQLYVFASIESPHYHPVCNENFDDFFNWTWTYKINSEVKWGYVDVKDIQGHIVGPNEDMVWTYDEDVVIDDQTFNILSKKTKAVAWLVSNCVTKSKREDYVKILRTHLKDLGFSIDIYGRCGNLDCGNIKRCEHVFRKDYYFYLSFENSFAEDYVTEKFNHAVNNYVVPIVWGGADYNRFAPPNSYINAGEKDAQDLASLIKFLIDNPFEYASYFKWRKYYQYSTRNDSPEIRGTCRFCKALNGNYYDKPIKTDMKYADFRGWWNAGVPQPCS